MPSPLNLQPIQTVIEIIPVLVQPLKQSTQSVVRDAQIYTFCYQATINFGLLKPFFIANFRSYQEFETSIWRN